MMAESVPATLSSVPTYLNWSGVYWAVAALEADGDDFAGTDCGLLAIGLPALVGGVVVVAAGVCTVLL